LLSAAEEVFKAAAFRKSSASKAKLQAEASAAKGGGSGGRGVDARRLRGIRGGEDGDDSDDKDGDDDDDDPDDDDEDVSCSIRPRKVTHIFGSRRKRAKQRS
jgi:hypothetical protein